MEREFMLWLVNLADSVSRRIGEVLYKFQVSALGQIQNGLLKAMGIEWTPEDLEKTRIALGYVNDQPTAGPSTLYSGMRPEDFIVANQKGEVSGTQVVLSPDVNGREVPALYNTWFDRYKYEVSATVILAIIGAIVAACYIYRDELKEIYSDMFTKFPSLEKWIPDFLIPEGVLTSNSKSVVTRNEDHNHATDEDYEAVEQFEQECRAIGYSGSQLAKMAALIEKAPSDAYARIENEARRLHAFKNKVDSIRPKQSGVTIRLR